VPLVEDIERRLLLEADCLDRKLDDERILVWLFNEPMAQRVEDLDRTTDDLKNLMFEQ